MPNEIQRLDWSGVSPTGSAYILFDDGSQEIDFIDGDIDGDIAYIADAFAVIAGGTSGVGDASASGSPITDVTYQGALANTNFPPPTIFEYGGFDSAPTITTIQEGGADFTASISTNQDDGIDNGAAWNDSSNQLYLGRSAGTSYTTALRFAVTIPIGATIDSATLTFRADSDQSSTCSVRIECSDEDDAAQISDSADLAGRARTSANTAWNAIEAWTTGNDFNSPSFAAALQEVCDRPGRSASFHVMIFLVDTANDSPRVAVSNDAGHATVISVNYTEAAPSGATKGASIYHNAFGRAL